MAKNNKKYTKQQLENMSIEQLKSLDKSLDYKKQPQEQNIYYVKYNTRLTPQQLNQKKSELGLIAIKHATSRPDLLPSAANIVLVSGDIKQIEKDNSIVSINPVEKLELFYDDPFYSDYYAGAYGNTLYNQQFLHNAHWGEAISEYGEGNSNPIIGMLDTRTYTGKPSWYAYSGYPDEHIDLEGKIEWNDNNGSPFPGGQSETSKGYHGEAVASLIVGNSNNGIGMVATCPNCTLVSFDWAAMSDLNDPESIMGVLTECIEREIKIINVSLGCKNCSYDDDVQNAINDAYNQGTVMVVAAGNEGGDIQYLGTNDFYVYCSYDNVWCVTSDSGANTSEYNWDSSCTYPPILPSAQGTVRVDGCTRIDFSAPKAVIAANNLFYFPSIGFDEYGTNVYADTNYDNLPSPALYREFNGTSSSTPLVSGLAGLLLSHHPDLTLDDIYWIIANSNIEEYEYWNTESSFEGRPGSINFYEALCISYGDCIMPNNPVAEYAPGDINQDGIINVVDIVAAVDCILSGDCPPIGNWVLEDVMPPDNLPEGALPPGFEPSGTNCIYDGGCQIQCGIECSSINCYCDECGTCDSDYTWSDVSGEGYWWGNCICNCDCNHNVGMDVNQDGINNVVDIIFLVNMILSGGVLSNSDYTKLSMTLQKLVISNISTKEETQILLNKISLLNGKGHSEQQVKLVNRKSKRLKKR